MTSDQFVALGIKQLEVTMCEHKDCVFTGLACSYPLTPQEEEPDAYYCGEHAAEHGFCAGCGHFSAGQSGFDFQHPGWCDNCHSEQEDDSFDDEEEWEDFYADAV